MRDAAEFGSLVAAGTGEAQMYTQESAMKRAFLTRSRILAASLVILSLGCVDSLFARPRAGEARVVKYSKKDIVPIQTKLRFSTLIILPENEDIIDFTTGDKDFWIINGAHNLCYVHPAQAGIRSNLNLVTASGHVYSFLLTEISREPNAEPELKVFIELDDRDSNPKTGYVRAGEAEAYKAEADTTRAQAQDQIRAAEARAIEEINKFRADYPTKLRFDYRLPPDASREPFLVSAIYHDDTFTYIECGAPEKPALYEVKDGKPNLIDFQYQNGVYIVAKILDSGYLTVGKKKLTFWRQPSGN
jgi:type IV secretion system protein VirB9